MSALALNRRQILAYRRRVGALDERIPRGKRSLRRAAWAGLQDSMPRAALLSLHARVAGIEPDALGDPSLVQLWGPRFSVYVVAETDRAVFTLGRLPDEPSALQRAEDLAVRLCDLLGDRSMPFGEAGRALGEPPNRLRYATATGTVLLEWDGARQPKIRTVPRPDVDPADARRELARRYLHVFGPSTPEAFAAWAGIREPRGTATFAALSRSLTAVDTPIGEAWILSRDETEFRTDHGPTAPARLLPSGDTYYLLQGDQRELLVPDADGRSALWTARVWPGAVLVEGEIVGVWRRSQAVVTVQPWQRLAAKARTAVEAEASALPLPGIEREIAVLWEG